MFSDLPTQYFSIPFTIPTANIILINQRHLHHPVRFWPEHTILNKRLNNFFDVNTWFTIRNFRFNPKRCVGVGEQLDPTSKLWSLLWSLFGPTQDGLDLIDSVWPHPKAIYLLNSIWPCPKRLGSESVWTHPNRFGSTRVCLAPRKTFWVFSSLFGPILNSFDCGQTESRPSRN